MGAGIILQPTGQAVLGRLGMLDEVEARGARLDSLLCQTTSGRRVADLTYSTLGPGLHGTGLHRGVLFQALFSRVQREVASLRCGVAIEDLLHERSRVSLPGRATTRGDRLFVIDEHGGRHGPHDLVIVADGARSRLRDDTNHLIEKSIRPYPYGALWFLASDPKRHFQGRLFQIVRGSRHMLGFLPTGSGPDRSENLTSIYWSFPEAEVEALRRRPVAEWKDGVRSLFSAPAFDPIRSSADELVDGIQSHQHLLFSGYFDVQMWPWATDRVVYLGDAAHAMSPQLGQGCNLALMDALVLAECLHARPLLEDALATYCHRRRAHLRIYQQATRWLTPFFQSDHAPLGALRDIFMGPMASVPFMRGLMTKSMAGTLNNWFGGTIDLPDRAHGD